jgi:hypothetical protein
VVAGTTSVLAKDPVDDLWHEVLSDPGQLRHGRQTNVLPLGDDVELVVGLEPADQQRRRWW